MKHRGLFISFLTFCSTLIVGSSLEDAKRWTMPDSTEPVAGSVLLRGGVEVSRPLAGNVEDETSELIFLRTSSPQRRRGVKNAADPFSASRDRKKDEGESMPNQKGTEARISKENPVEPAKVDPAEHIIQARIFSETAARKVYAGNPLRDDDPTPLSFPSRLVEEERKILSKKGKTRYVLRLRDSFFKDLSLQSGKAGGSDQVFQHAGKELQAVYGNLVTYQQEDGSFYFTDKEKSDKQMEMMFYELVRDPEDYKQVLTQDTEEILTTLGGVKKSIAMLLKEKPLDSNVVRWYIDQVFQRIFGDKFNAIGSISGSLTEVAAMKNTNNSSDGSTADSIGSFVDVLTIDLIKKMSSLINDMKDRWKDGISQLLTEKREMLDSNKLVELVRSLLLTFESKVTAEMQSFSKTVSENKVELSKVSESVSELNNVILQENKKTYHGLYNALGSLSSMLKAIYEKVENVDAGQVTGMDEQKELHTMLEKVGHSLNILNEKDFNLNLEPLKNLTSNLVVSLGKFTKKELDETRRDIKELQSYMQHNFIARFDNSNSRLSSLKEEVASKMDEVLKQVTEKSLQLHTIFQRLGSMNGSLARMEELASNKLEQSILSSVPQQLMYISSTLTSTIMKLDNISKTVCLRTDPEPNKLLERELKERLSEILQMKSTLESQGFQNIAMLHNINSMVSNSNMELKDKLNEVVSQFSIVNDIRKDITEEVKSFHDDTTKTMVAGFQYGSVSGAMHQQQLQNFSKALSDIREKLDFFLEKTHVSFMKIATVIGEAYQPRKHEEPNCDVSEVVENIMSRVGSALEARSEQLLRVYHSKPVRRERSDANATLDEEDIRYNFEDLVWVLKSCHIGDKSLCGYAWCAKVCGFGCPFNCKQYVTCFEKYRGEKELVRDCYAGLDVAFVRSPSKEVSLRIQCSDGAVQGREVGINLAAFDSAGGNFYRQQVTKCNVSSIESIVPKGAEIRGYTILVSSCMKCHDHMDNWDGVNVTRLIDYINVNCSEKHHCNGWTADPTKICCTEYPCPSKDKEGCCEKSCLNYYRGAAGCYKPKILITSPFVRSYDLTSGSGVILGSLFVGKSVEISFAFPESCIVPGFQMIVAGMTQLPKGSKHPGQKAVELELGTTGKLPRLSDTN